MFNGAFALLERSLRVDARSKLTHLARLGLLVAIYVSLCWASMTSFMFGAPGLRFFQGIAYLDAVFMTLLGVGFFSTSITEEKEEDTLGLMLMAGISPMGLLLGKSGGRLWQSLLLVAVQFPFVLLAITLGGVMGDQVWSVTIALLAYMIFLAGFGLLCSTVAARGSSAAALMVVGLMLYFVVPIFAKDWYSAHAVSLANERQTVNLTFIVAAVIGFVGDISIFLELGQILQTSFSQTVWSVQVISNVVAGVLCSGLSWLLFGIATRSPSTEASSRGLVARQQRSSPFCAGRVWGNPFIWKDFHFVSGGTAMLMIRIAYYSGLGLTALYIEFTGDVRTSDWFGFCLFLMFLPLPFDAARVLSRCLQDEVRGQTLAPLMTLPCSSTGMIYSKFAGALLGWLPGPAIGLAVTVISPHLRKGLWDLMWEFNAVGSMMLFIFILFMTLIPHLAAFVSLYVRWGAVALAIALTIGIYIGLTMLLGILFFAFATFFGPGVGGDYVFVVFGGGALILIGLCAACHLGVLLRVQALAAK